MSGRTFLLLGVALLAGLLLSIGIMFLIASGTQELEPGTPVELGEQAAAQDERGRRLDAASASIKGAWIGGLAVGGATGLLGIGWIQSARARQKLEAGS